MALINTTRGPIEEHDLARKLGFEENPNEFVVWIEYRYEGELVRRDAHVIQKNPLPIANTLAGAIG
jgi:hypothetical protein